MTKNTVNAYVLTVVNTLDITPKTSVLVYDNENQAVAGFNDQQKLLQKHGETAGTYFLDPMIYGTYENLIMTYKNDAGRIFLQKSC